MIENHKTQNYTEAEELATRAYLDNFDSLNQISAKHDQKLVEDTEVLLRQELRQRKKTKNPKTTRTRQ